MTNDLEPAKRLLDSVDYKTLNVLGVMRNVNRGLQKLHTTLGGFGLFDLPIEQLIRRVNMLFQHYNALTNLSRKLDASLAYLQLQLGIPYNPFTLDYNKWGDLAPLSWTKMLWKSLNKFDIMLDMAYSPIPFPRERDQVIMEMIFSHDLTFNVVKSFKRCRGALEAIFLSDITTADGRYLKHFIFDPGRKTSWSHYKFPLEQPARENWGHWMNFWHSFTMKGGKLKVPLGR
jgi:hypothetical protein